MGFIPRDSSASCCGQPLHHWCMWTVRRSISQLLWSLASYPGFSVRHARNMCLVSCSNKLSLVSCSTHNQWLLLQCWARRGANVDQRSILLSPAPANHQLCRALNHSQSVSGSISLLVHCVGGELAMGFLGMHDSCWSWSRCNILPGRNTFQSEESSSFSGFLYFTAGWISTG